MTIDELKNKANPKIDDNLKELDRLAAKAEREAQKSKQFHETHVSRIVKK